MPKRSASIETRDHCTLAETDRFSNLVRIRGIRLNLYGKSKEEEKAILGDGGESDRPGPKPNRPRRL
ncbi:hypothetical protein MPNT_100052 [Candidatus Methylacidithermus pantelleriae]|uniref:Uncharacterized protein n=1 Tax=Candidatus Methylacidithermus pantelleriae TaxID=2744239 RepID=A0A8J2FNC7_9BACT|nr:hypothetical protein MPNT_100052 [Candidatus Methylacidithermus pantelleriae]